MTEHTPGPWKIGKSAIFENHGFKVHGFPVAGSGQAIAVVWNGSVGKEALNFGNQEANARLIAAAPDLLAALKAAHGALDHESNAPPMSTRELVALLAAAIAKAEEEPCGGI